jgi:starch synthase (maltosyl-transferring)
VLAAADMLLLTSAWEGMPNVVLEAMAAGKPVVATNAEGVAELLGPLSVMDAEKLGGNGLVRQLVEHGDASGFVDAVAYFANNPSVATKVGHYNQSRAAEEFSFERMVQRYCELYRQLL